MHITKLCISVKICTIRFAKNCNTAVSCKSVYTVSAQTLQLTDLHGSSTQRLSS